MTFSRFFHVVEEGGGGEEEEERLLAAERQEPFVVENMTATEANNRKGSGDVGVEIPDTAHQISSGTVKIRFHLSFIDCCYFDFY